MKFKDKKVLEVDLKDYPKIKINNKIFEVKEGSGHISMKMEQKVQLLHIL